MGKVAAGECRGLQSSHVRVLCVINREANNTKKPLSRHSCRENCLVAHKQFLGNRSFKNLSHYRYPLTPAFFVCEHAIAHHRA